MPKKQPQLNQDSQHVECESSRTKWNPLIRARNGLCKKGHFHSFYDLMFKIIESPAFL